jgi:phospholipid/cholesterol/gamma-HCH transport system substrate-binding protein
MRRSRRKRQNVTVLTAGLGTAAILLAAVIGWVSYHALEGLPFQPVYRVSAAIPDADRLIPTADVRIGGVRVGDVTSVTAERGTGGRPYALIGLALSPSIGRLPVDTTARAASVSPLGATFVQLRLGAGPNRIAPGGTLPLSNSTATVSVTDLYQIFNHGSARSFQSAIGSLGAGVEGRGPAVNTTISSTNDLLPELKTVASDLASPTAHLSGFISGFASAASALAPTGQQLAQLLSGGASTFNALVRAQPFYTATLDAAPTAESATTVAFVRVDPGLNAIGRLMTALEPAATGLPRSLATLNAMLRQGISPLRQLPTLTDPLRTTLAVLERVSQRQSTTGGLRKLHDLMFGADGILAALTPAQVHCNLIGTFSQSAASYLGTLGTGDGPALANTTVGAVGVPGEQVQGAKPASTLHDNLLPIENAQQCQANNEPYQPGQHIGNPAGPIPDSTRPTSPPPGVLARAQSVGLLAPHTPGS